MTLYHVRKEINGYDPLRFIFLVVRNSDGYVMGQHATREDAHEQFRRLNANAENQLRHYRG